MQEARAEHWETLSQIVRTGNAFTWDGNQYKMVNLPLDERLPQINATPTWTANDQIGFDYPQSAAWSAYGQQGATASATHTYNISIKLRWVRDAGQPAGEDPAPKAVSVHLRSTATVFVSPRAGSSYTLDNGLGTPITPTEPEDGSYASYSSNGTKRINIANPNSDTELPAIELTITSTGSARRPVVFVPGSYGSSGGDSSVQLNADFNALRVSNAVAISSSIDQSYVKSDSPPPDAAAQPVPAPMPNTDPPAWRVPVRLGQPVHSVAQWLPLNVSSHSTSTDWSWFGQGTYTGYQSGLSDPIAWTWSIAPNSFVNYLVSTYPQYSNGGQSVSIGPSTVSAGPGERHTSGYDLSGSHRTGPQKRSTTFMVTAKDASLLLQSEPYTVNWHAPLENFELKLVKEDNARAVTAARNTTNEVGPTGTALADFDYTRRREVGDWHGDYLAKSLQLIGAMPDIGWWGVLANGLEILADEKAEEFQEVRGVGVPHAPAWAESQVMAAAPWNMTGLIPPDALRTDCAMVRPLLIQKLNDYFKKCDEYDEHGYKATLNKMKRVPSGPHLYAGVFESRAPAASSTPPTTPPASSAESGQGEVDPEPTPSSTTS